MATLIKILGNTSFQGNVVFAAILRWILTTGFWNDNENWNDNEKWKDY